MNALTVWQPWASLIAAGLKLHETRGWPTNQRGPLVIHAAKRWEQDQVDVIYDEPFRSAMDRMGVMLPPWRKALAARFLPLGCAVGVARIVDCFPTDEPEMRLHHIPRERWRDEIAFGDWRPGRFAFRLADAVEMQNLPMRGKQGFFRVPNNVAAIADAALSVQALKTSGWVL